MSIKQIRDGLVNAAVERPLFKYEATAVSLHALVDGVAQTVVFVAESRNPSDGRLCALWSSSPLPLDSFLTGMHEAHHEWLEQLWDATGPFA